MAATVTIVAKPQAEHGAAIIELLMITPVLLLFIFAILDFSIYIKTMGTMDTAATAAVRWVQEQPGQIIEQDTGKDSSWIRPPRLKTSATDSLSAYLNTAISETNMFGKPVEEGGVDVSVELGEHYTNTYTHRLYDDSSVLLERDNSHVSFLPFTVTIGCNLSFPTPIGKVIGASLTHTVKQSGTIDMLDGETW